MSPKADRPSAEELQSLAGALRHTWFALSRTGAVCSASEGARKQGIWVLGRLMTGPLRMSQLAERAEVSSASLTGVVDRLEERGFVVRSRSDEDRRVVTVAITDEGRAEFDAIRAAFNARLEGMLESFTRDERRELTRLLDKLNS